MNALTSTAPATRHLQDDDETVFAEFDGAIARRFFGFVTPYRRWLVGALAAVALFVASQVAIPLFIKWGVDNAVHGGAALGWILAGFLSIIVTNAIGGYLQERLAAGLAQRVIFDLRRAMFLRLQDVSLSILDQTHVGRIMSRLQGDVNALQEFLETSVSAIGDFFLLIGIVTVLLLLDWRLGLLTMTVLPAIIGIRALWLPRVRDTFRRAKDASSIVNAALAENINGVRAVIGARREPLNLALFEAKARANRVAQTDAAWAAQIMVPTVETLTGIAQGLIVLAGGYGVLTGRIEIGMMVAFIFYVQRFFDPIATLSQQYTVMQRAMAGAHRIFEVIDVPILIDDASDAVPLDMSEPSIEFRNVTFGYISGRPVLHDLNFRVEPGQTLALVGPTGSGKTSIAGLVKRFHETWEGSVQVGGQDVRSVTRASLGRAVAMVLQEPFLFSGTVLENIRYASDATDDQVIAAAKAVGAHAFIMKLPQAYVTALTQRGQNFSLGQRQLLSFARALVADPQILILDEATANIDSFTERDIQAALKLLLKGRTSLVIAHRLATIRDADNILVLQNGRIVEQGNHAKLLANGGLYCRLHSQGGASFDDALSA
ncbi:ABC transporter ATP-binding protein [soil metagenome]